MAKILFVGNSHIVALHGAWSLDVLGDFGLSLEFFHLKFGRTLSVPNRDETILNDVSNSTSPGRDDILLEFTRQARDATHIVFLISGNEHNAFSLVDVPGISLNEISSLVRSKASKHYKMWLDLLKSATDVSSYILLPPPPMESEEWIKEHPSRFSEKLASSSVRNALERLHVYNAQCDGIRELGRRQGLSVIELPDGVLSPTGFLAEDCRSTHDPTHGNMEYGRRVLRHVLSFVSGTANFPAEGSTLSRGHVGASRHPYANLPDYAYWRQSISEVPQGELDPVTTPPFRIHQKDKVATAGSCFAQHISKRLREGGFNFLVTESPGGDESERESRGFYDFSARYGNIYTARQLVQLFDRAFGYFKPIERIWERHAGGYCDPFRPRIEPEGFPSEKAVLRDTQGHFAAVRRMFRTLNVFVFTLGLTECWMSRLDGAVYPVAPGVVGGEFDPKKHVFVNFGVSEVVADLRLFLDKLLLVNPGARVILTVSPVPLVATCEDQHVLVSTTYSKSVLRVAADDVSRSYGQVYYFPSYEIITGSQAGGTYFGPDRRSVTKSGVDHVMRVFMNRLTENGAGSGLKAPVGPTKEIFAEMEALAEAVCDEELYAQ